MQFVATIKFTEQGISRIKETCKRADSFKSEAEKMGVKVTDLFWTLGPFDGLIVLEAPDEDTATAVMLALGSKGNVQTQTCRALDATEMQKVIDKMP